MGVVKVWSKCCTCETSPPFLDILHFYVRSVLFAPVQIISSPVKSNIYTVCLLFDIFDISEKRCVCWKIRPPHSKITPRCESALRKYEDHVFKAIISIMSMHYCHNSRLNVHLSKFVMETDARKRCQGHSGQEVGGRGRSGRRSGRNRYFRLSKRTVTVSLSVSAWLIYLNALNIVRWRTSIFAVPFPQFRWYDKHIKWLSDP